MQSSRRVLTLSNTLRCSSYLSPEPRVPQDHPLRKLRHPVYEVLQEPSPHFHRMYAPVGRPSIAPEKLLRALLLRVLDTVRSGPLRMEQWAAVGLKMDDAGWHGTV